MDKIYLNKDFGIAYSTHSIIDYELVFIYSMVACIHIFMNIFMNPTYIEYFYASQRSHLWPIVFYKNWPPRIMCIYLLCWRQGMFLLFGINQRQIHDCWCVNLTSTVFRSNDLILLCFCIFDKGILSFVRSIFCSDQTLLLFQLV